ncbi:transmembrane-type terpene cyclase [Actinoplanes xinjiangensis]|uniref:Uncharacterized protein n=1 Tax=Actinoplanes xinjiangensis TaxID=512350 RepID=A0A316EXV2_9ACTN|nr:hypothetical protein [Actinoplanes xinjiangensis]PWK36033.1 hypothetical protein BC793_12414 [Actinoplanes xinjiangensis]GIF42969.1 hypothetical protein Axi01nite_72800 [Actinoplanes xinjiangensis]
MISDAVVVTGVICVLFWMIAYFGIIYRGFRDQSFGMPITALAANLSWEASYGFILDPMGDHIHLLSIPCFFIDLVIAWQCLRYGRKDFQEPLIQRFYPAIFFGAIVIAFPIVFLGFLEFEDPDGEYTGFGINFMMSILFIAMLLRRGSSRGQSLYIAIAKWQGTLFAWIATALTVTTSATNQWPDSLGEFFSVSLGHTEYPLTPLINVLYGVTFVVDIIYIVLLYQQLRAEGKNPWRRL